MPGPFTTDKQDEMILHLQREYGEADLVSIPIEEGPYADVTLIWWDQKRRLTVQPDGTRRNYNHLTKAEK